MQESCFEYQMFVVQPTEEFDFSHELFYSLWTGSGESLDSYFGEGNKWKYTFVDSTKAALS